MHACTWEIGANALSGAKCKVASMYVCAHTYMHDLVSPPPDKVKFRAGRYVSNYTLRPISLSVTKSARIGSRFSLEISAKIIICAHA